MAQVIKKFYPGGSLSQQYTNVGGQLYNTDTLRTALLNPKNLKNYASYYNIDYDTLKNNVDILVNGIFSNDQNNAYTINSDYSITGEGLGDLQETQQKQLGYAAGYAQEILKQMSPYKKRDLDISEAFKEYGKTLYPGEGAFAEAFKNYDDSQKREFGLNGLRYIAENINPRGFNVDANIKDNLTTWLNGKTKDYNFTKDDIETLRKYGIYGISDYFIKEEQEQPETTQTQSSDTTQSQQQDLQQDTSSQSFTTPETQQNDPLQDLETLVYRSLQDTDEKEIQFNGNLPNTSRFNYTPEQYLRLAYNSFSDLNSYEKGVVLSGLKSYLGNDTSIQLVKLPNGQNTLKLVQYTQTNPDSHKISFGKLFNESNLDKYLDTIVGSINGYGNTNYTIDDLKKAISKLAKQNTVSSQKKGGIIKAQSGSSIKEADRDTHNQEIISQVGFDAADYVRLGSLALDVSALIASFGNPVASGTLGMASAATDLVADFMDKGVSARQAATNLLVNTGSAALGVMSGGKAVSIGQKLIKSAPKVVAVLGGSTAAINFAGAIKHGQENGFDNLTREDWRNIYYGLKTAAFASSAISRNAWNKKMFGKYTDEVTVVKTKNGETRPLSRAQIAEIQNNKDAKSITAYLKSQQLMGQDDEIATSSMSSILRTAESTPAQLITKAVLKPQAVIESENNGVLPEDYISFAKSQFGFDPLGTEHTADWLSINPLVAARNLIARNSKPASYGRSVKAAAKEIHVDDSVIHTTEGSVISAEAFQSGHAYIADNGEIKFTTDLSSISNKNRILDIDQKVKIDDNNETTLRELLASGKKITIGNGKTQLPDNVTIEAIRSSDSDGALLEGENAYLSRIDGELVITKQPIDGSIKLDSKKLLITIENKPMSLFEASNKGYQFKVIENNNKPKTNSAVNENAAASNTPDSESAPVKPASVESSQPKPSNTAMPAQRLPDWFTLSKDQELIHFNDGSSPLEINIQRLGGRKYKLDPNSGVYYDKTKKRVYKRSLNKKNRVIDLQIKKRKKGGVLIAGTGTVVPIIPEHKEKQKWSFNDINLSPFIELGSVHFSNSVNDKAIRELNSNLFPVLKTPVTKISMPISGNYSAKSLSDSIQGNNNNLVYNLLKNTSNARTQRSIALENAYKNAALAMDIGEKTIAADQKALSDAINVANANTESQINTANANNAAVLQNIATKASNNFQGTITKATNWTNFLKGISTGLHNEFVLRRLGNSSIRKETIAREYKTAIDDEKDKFNKWYDLLSDEDKKIYTTLPYYKQYINNVNKITDDYKNNLEKLQDSLYGTDRFFRIPPYYEYESREPYEIATAETPSNAKGGTLSYTQRASLKTIDNINKNIRSANNITYKNLRERKISDNLLGVVKSALGIK